MQAGDLIAGKYKIIRLLGKGGMSQVYAAMDLHLLKIRAVKVIREKNHFYSRELQLLKTSEHPLFPYVIDYIEEEGKTFLVMEYIEGQTLDEFLNEQEFVSAAKILSFARQLAEGISSLHHQTPPVYYLDFKPENIIVQNRETLRLIDFGIAGTKGERGSTAFGTKGFAAPEQYGDESGRVLYEVDEKTDLYGIGAVLSACSRKGQEKRKYFKEVRRLKKIIGKCMRQNPKERYQSGEELLRAIEKAKGRRGIPIAIFFCLIVAAGYTESRSLARKHQMFLQEEKEQERKSNELFFAQGLSYFGSGDEYELAYQAFQKVDQAALPEAAYYSNLSESLSKRGAPGLEAHLKKFQQYIHKMAEQNSHSQRVLSDYKSIIQIISVYTEQKHNNELLKLCREGLRLALSFPEKKEVKKEYEIFFHNQMAAVLLEEEQLLEGGRELKKLWDLLKGGADRKLQEKTICSLASVYERLGQTEKAIDCYEEGKAVLKNNSRELYIQYLNLLLKSDRQEKLKEIYAEAKNIEGMEQDVRFVKWEKKQENVVNHIWKGEHNEEP